MPGVIDPETFYIDELPGIWSPIQWDLTEEEHIKEVQDQSTASLLWSVGALEAILRLLLNETGIERTLESPEGFDPELQGEWDDSIVTFKFKRHIKLERIDRGHDDLYVEYHFGDFGRWSFEIEKEKVVIKRI